MGLDAVELILAVEEKFGISISDEEAQNALTVGDLKRLVRAKLDRIDTDACLSQRAFHLIRKNAMDEFGLPRRSLRPDTQLEDVVPRTNRRERWEQFQLALGVAPLPALIRSPSVIAALMVLTLSIFVVTTWYAVLHSMGPGSALLVAFAAGAAVGWLSVLTTLPLKTHFKTGYDKVQDLVRLLVARYPHLLGKPRTTKWTEDEVWCLLRELITEQLGVSEFDENSRFVDDLHID